MQSQELLKLPEKVELKNMLTIFDCFLGKSFT